jgi:hypothetical protein
LDETRPCPRHQDAGRGRGIDVDVPDIDRTANEGAQFRQRRKYLARASGEAISDDDIDIACGLDQAGGVECIVRFMQLDLRDGLQPVKAALAIVLGARLRRVGQQDFHVSSRRRAAMPC